MPVEQCIELGVATARLVAIGKLIAIPLWALLVVIAYK